MLIPDLDIFRSANVLVKQHGQDAPIQAAMRADAVLEAGDVEGCEVFKRTLRVVASRICRGSGGFGLRKTLPCGTRKAAVRRPFQVGQA